ncbi:MAG TPA: amidohydrolase family protein [Candidatus Dormibacteraeota bacterium]|jgi:predicted TIM-barrel fold metal-dependent hydrolase|nr:amidohydrolase family protein [Candidatus Dormibacteraeota bacterium]
MYRGPDGTAYYVVDGHVHFWDGSPANQKNVYGKGFIECFYAYHRNLSPPEWVWPEDRFQKYDEATLVRDLFEEGYVDRAIFLPTYLKDFFVEGFNTTEQDAVLKEKYPDRFILNGSFDPRDGDAALDYLEHLAATYHIPGVKLYTAEWRGASRGWKLSDPEAKRCLARCQELGIRNIHVHKGPTIWPLNRDAFDVADVDDAATSFPELNFIVEHCGLPRLEDFCWIATQEPNVYAGLAVAIPFIYRRPRYFAEVLSELLFWIGEDRILFASDYAIWSPKWIIERFVDFQLPEDIRQETGVELTTEAKRKILGLNAARLYDLEVPQELRLPTAAAV